MRSRLRRVAKVGALPSLREYVLVHQDTPQIEVFRYPEDEHDIYTAGSFRLECLDMELSVESVYADLD